MNALTFKRVSFSLCVAFLKRSTMVTNTQITHHRRDPIQHRDMEGYALLTPNHFLPAPTCGPGRIVKVFRPKCFKWQQIFYQSRNYSIKDKKPASHGCNVSAYSLSRRGFLFKAALIQPLFVHTIRWGDNFRAQWLAGANSDIDNKLSDLWAQIDS